MRSALPGFGSRHSSTRQLHSVRQAHRPAGLGNAAGWNSLPWRVRGTPEERYSLRTDLLQYPKTFAVVHLHKSHQLMALYQRIIAALGCSYMSIKAMVISSAGSNPVPACQEASISPSLMGSGDQGGVGFQEADHLDDCPLSSMFCGCRP